MTATPERTDGRRLRPRIWIGLVALVVYILFAAGLGNVLGGLAGDDATAEFALSHLIPLPIAIGLALLFVRWAGWWGPVWRETPTVRLNPRRWWLVSIPMFALLIPLGQVFTTPWADRAVSFILIVAVGTLLVGLGEELVCRGILLVSVRERHGEFVTLLVTAVAFALAHVYSSIWHRLPPAAIAFQVSFLALSGITFYWVRRVSGRLWVAVLIHAFTDFVLYVGAEAGNPAEALPEASSDPGNPVSAIAQILLMAVVLASVVSVIREDLRTRRAARSV
ncbi:CPBP family intramembrane glutamic endopeptidase [Microbacterium sp. SA39]|uniref:CPBP family intramembrane glutamic endopeptidase n=1 Tax=Microbacterium sp. SA39 TaxID=1263625 RepID=UPI0005F9B346|nr:type II CAAX endopeptidase family protein [Microbacterium sp. SA39]KJQ53835.1 CAAX amino terminal protease self- immunity [Microbacterium sp. SA39]